MKVAVQQEKDRNPIWWKQELERQRAAHVKAMKVGWGARYKAKRSERRRLARLARERVA